MTKELRHVTPTVTVSLSKLSYKKILCDTARANIENKIDIHQTALVKVSCTYREHIFQRSVANCLHSSTDAIRFVQRYSCRKRVRRNWWVGFDSVLLISLG